jgi:hypothetical protein
MKEINKNNIILGVLVGGVVVAVGFVVYFWLNPIFIKREGPPFEHPLQKPDFDLMSADLKDYRDLLGNTHNVFVGRVIKEIGIQSQGSTPHTQFDVRIIYNIKGNAQADIVVDQNGGSVDGKVVAAEADSPAMVTQSADYLLQPGYAYVLATRHFEGSGPYYLSLRPIAKKIISRDIKVTDAELDKLARGDDGVYQLLAAYINEKISSADLYRNTAFNSFESLSSSERQIVFSKFQQLIPPHSVPKTLPPTPISSSTPERVFSENNYSLCHDNIDNDKDGLTDVADPSCAAFYPSKPNPVSPPSIISSSTVATPPAQSTSSQSVPLTPTSTATDTSSSNF